MSRKAAVALIASAALAISLAGCSSGGSGGSDNTSKKGGLISIIVNDPSNPYWLTEGNVASAEAKRLGYKSHVGASKGDTNTESNLIDTAI
jgi:erythritol transport system substrate-binding protein